MGTCTKGIRWESQGEPLSSEFRLKGGADHVISGNWTHMEKPRISYRTIIYTSRNMSTPFPALILSKKRKRPLTGIQGDEEGSGGQDPDDLEIRPPSAPPLRVRSDGQDFNATKRIPF